MSYYYASRKPVERRNPSTFMSQWAAKERRERIRFPLRIDGYVVKQPVYAYVGTRVSPPPFHCPPRVTESDDKPTPHQDPVFDPLNPYERQRVPRAIRNKTVSRSETPCYAYYYQSSKNEREFTEKPFTPLKYQRNIQSAAAVRPTPKDIFLPKENNMASSAVPRQQHQPATCDTTEVSQEMRKELVVNPTILSSPIDAERNSSDGTSMDDHRRRKSASGKIKRLERMIEDGRKQSEQVTKSIGELMEMFRRSTRPAVVVKYRG